MTHADALFSIRVIPAESNTCPPAGVCWEGLSPPAQFVGDKTSTYTESCSTVSLITVRRRHAVLAAYNCVEREICLPFSRPTFLCKGRLLLRAHTRCNPVRFDLSSERKTLPHPCPRRGSEYYLCKLVNGRKVGVKCLQRHRRKQVQDARAPLGESICRCFLQTSVLYTDVRMRTETPTLGERYIQIGSGKTLPPVLAFNCVYAHMHSKIFSEMHVIGVTYSEPPH